MRITLLMLITVTSQANNLLDLLIINKNQIVRWQRQSFNSEIREFSDHIGLKIQPINAKTEIIWSIAGKNSKVSNATIKALAAISNNNILLAHVNKKQTNWYAQIDDTSYSWQTPTLELKQAILKTANHINHMSNTRIINIKVPAAPKQWRCVIHELKKSCPGSIWDIKQTNNNYILLTGLTSNCQPKFRKYHL